MRKAPLIIVAVIIISLLGIALLSSKFLTSKQAASSQAVKPGPTTASVPKLTLAYSFTKANQLPVAVAIQKGLFKKYNVDVDIKEVSKNVTSVLTAGQANVILSTPNIALPAAVVGAKISWIGSINNDQATVVVSSKDLKNIKTIGVITGPSRAQTIGLLNLIKVSTAKLTVQELADNQAKLIALKEKQVDAIHVAKPDWLIYKKNAKLSNEYKILFDSSTNSKAWMPISIIVRNEFLQNNKEVVENFAKALLEADAWIQKNPEEFTKMIEERFTDISKEDIDIQTHSYLDTLDNLQFAPTIEKGQEMLDLVKVDNKAASDYKVENFIAPGIADSLTKSGFLTQLRLNSNLKKSGTADK